MDVTKYFKDADLNWDTVSTLPERLRALGLFAGQPEAELDYSNELYGFRVWNEAAEHVKKHSAPHVFRIELKGVTGPNKEAAGFGSITISELCGSNGHQMKIRGWNVPNDTVIDEVAKFLGFQVLEDEAEDTPKKPSRTAFIAHRFDMVGESTADRLARFLSLLGFEVKTGRGFSPKSVAEKVKERMQTQAVVFVVFTPGDDTTWLNQETILSYAQGKPLFVLVDQTEQKFKPALLGDQEYIPFTAPHVDATFIPILEGLTELGYSLGGRKRVGSSEK